PRSIACRKGDRGADNRMRIHFIRALGSMHDHRATPIPDEDRHPTRRGSELLINRLAGEEVGKLGDPGGDPR
ncbi:MAG: hypothetical protein M5U28_49390, partial [Sandaracinaceae bacterium]|nr:hypothetical protein [Sandaracinaceae bacterium]